MKKVIICKNERFFKGINPSDGQSVWSDDRTDALKLPVGAAITRVKRLQKNYQTKITVEPFDVKNKKI